MKVYFEILRILLLNLYFKKRVKLEITINMTRTAIKKYTFEMIRDVANYRRFLQIGEIFQALI